MTTTVSEYIPREKLSQFHAILCATGGRYLRNPFQIGDRVHVNYEPGDYVAHCVAWARCTTQIREVRKNQWWRVALRRCGLRA